MSNTHEVKGVVPERGIKFRNDESGFTILKVRTERGNLVTLKGVMAPVQEGNEVVAKGKWVEDPKFGRQLEIKSAEVGVPDNAQGVVGYLGSGAVKGIGPKAATLMVDKFGKDGIFDVLNNHPEKLLEVDGIGKKKLEAIKKSWKEAQGTYKVMKFLREIGIGPERSKSIYNALGGPEGKDVAGVIRNNPYKLVEVKGIGFSIADQAGLKIGIKKDSAYRITAGLIHALDEASGEGHTRLFKTDLLTKAHELLGLSRSDIRPVLEDMAGKEKVISGKTAGKEFVALPALYKAEQRIVKEIERLTERGRQNKVPKVSAQQGSIVLADQQVRAIEMGVSEPVSILTGGPGTGKTTITECICKYEKENKGHSRIMLGAPTGRAAKQLGDATGREAMTIHRMIGIGGGEAGKPLYNENNPLEVDLLVLDESSMTDVPLMNRLLRAVPDGARVLFVGDKDQLPSVGPGNVLRDMLTSNRIPFTKLDRVQRQGKGSDIAIAAPMIRDGKRPTYGRDFKLNECETNEEIADSIINKFCGLVATGESTDDIQVLSPMRDGAVGVKELNSRLQESLNPQRGGKPEIKVNGERFREGDRVMQTKNDYNLGVNGVFNGDQGKIVSVEPRDRKAMVSINGELVQYNSSKLQNMTLSYAITTHKSQGGQFKHVIMPMTTSHFIMLNRELYYTGVTRAKQDVSMYGTEKAANLSVERQSSTKRNTGLIHGLRDSKVLSVIDHQAESDAKKAAEEQGFDKSTTRSHSGSKSRSKGGADLEEQYDDRGNQLPGWMSASGGMSFSVQRSNSSGQEEEKVNADDSDFDELDDLFGAAPS